MIVRSATPADADALLAFFEQYAEPSLTDTAEAVGLLLAHPTTSVLLAEDGDRLVGTIVAGWDGWRGNLYHLAVAVDRRREGIALRLVEEALERLQTHGARRVNALVLDDHEYATATWAAAGFQPTSAMSRWFKMLS